VGIIAAMISLRDKINIAQNNRILEAFLYRNLPLRPNVLFLQRKKIFSHSMAKFHSLKIKDVRRETAQCVSIAFDIPKDLKDEFAYKQGQYITLKVNVKGEEMRRSYSACSSPIADADLRIAVKAIDGGRVSGLLNNGIAAGDYLEVMRPMGNFYVDMPADSTQHIVGFAAGSGITPVMSLLKTALKVNGSNTFTLFYGNRESSQIIFKEELDALKTTYGNRLQVVHLLSREEHKDPLFSGRISTEKCVQLMERYTAITAADHYFLCGPFDMIQGIRTAFKNQGIADEKVHFELFTTEAPRADEADGVTENEDNNSPVDQCEVTVILDGEENQVMVTKADNILDAILDAGLDAPYACTGGSCCTCRAKVLEGKAVMEVNYALTEKEVAQGYILTCQSHPTTAKMIVDYDAP
jgi:ring-1,2-phenylacetyl-CoA epoxidase subunit PaaE